MAKTKEPPEAAPASVSTDPEAPAVDDRRTIYDYLGIQLQEAQKATVIGDYLDGNTFLPTRVLSDIRAMLYRIPRADRTVTRPFDEGDRQLIRNALTTRSDGLQKEAKRLGDQLYPALADRLYADAKAITDRLLPEFYEQRELPMAPADDPESPVETPEGSKPELVGAES